MGLTSLSNKSEARRAEFLAAPGLEKGEEKLSPKLQYSRTPQPSLKLEPTKLPRFTGSQRNLFSWWKDQENLARQRDPSSSAEGKKIQLLNRLGEKMRKDTASIVSLVAVVLVDSGQES